MLGRLVTVVGAVVVVLALGLGFVSQSPWIPSDLPSTMKAVMTTEKGKVQVISVPVPLPEPGQVLLKMSYAPVNPSDVYHALGEYRSASKSFPYGNGFEGSGTAVAAGSGPLPHLYARLGVKLGGGMPAGGSWAEYAVVDVGKAVPLALTGVQDLEGSAAFVNPMTVVGFLETAREGGHHAIVHTAGNSALGKMLIRASKSYNVTVIAVIRGEANERELVAELGHPRKLVVRSDLDGFEAALKQVVRDTSATLAFDAISGPFTKVIAAAMPQGAEVYVYGMLSDQPNEGFPFWMLLEWLEAKQHPMRLPRTGYGMMMMLKNELSTKFEHILELSDPENIVSSLEAYKQYQKGGKIVLKLN